MHLVQKTLKTFCDILTNKLKSGGCKFAPPLLFRVDNSDEKNSNLVKIAPQIELFPMSQLNEAIERLHSGQARYRIVLKADFAE